VSLLFPALCGAREVLRVGDVGLSADQLARRMAGHLARLPELAPGARIAVVTEPGVATAVALAAHAAAGLVSVPLNPAAGASELAHVLADARPAVVLGPPNRTAGLGLPSLPLDAPERDEAPPLRSVDDAPVLILYTSGTTGPPKGAVLTARNVATNLDGLAAVWGWTAADTVVHALPLFHVHGLVLGWFGVLRNGSALRWVTPFSPEALGAALCDDSTVLFSVPTMIHRLSRSDAPAALAGLERARLLVSGSAALSAVDRDRVQARTGRTVIERYGLTETLIVAAARPGEAATVGRPVPGVEVRRVDDDGGDAAPDALGEVWVRGPSVFAGYLNRPEATAAVVRDGWFCTGDLATADAEGRLRIVGRRATDLLKTGGYKVGAGEVEDALLAHPAVAEAAVVGRPDDDLGERIVAYVVRREAVTEGELVAHVAAQLAAHKRPREVYFVDALPRNAMGKLQKTRLP
jgi:malonyl-CoA/methylmalonyl-CoA synthetase